VEWLNEVSFSIDIPSLRQRVRDPFDLADMVANAGWAKS